ncbi:hypothetical protein ACWTU6_14030 [Mesorhizobium sp. BHbsci]
MVGHEFAKAVAGTTARKTASEIDRNMDVSPSPEHATSTTGVGMVQLMPECANHDDAADLRQAAIGRLCLEVLNFSPRLVAASVEKIE